MHPLIAARRSPRAFDPTPLDPTVITDLFEAARWAPSGMNGQPWRFVLAPVTDPDAHAAALSALTPGNQRWAGAAPLLGVACVELEPGKPNPNARLELGLALAQLTVQATAHGLAVHLMGGFVPDVARAAFAIPAHVEIPVAFAVGRAGDPDALPDDLRARELAPRTRRPLGELVFSGRWGRA